MNRVFYGLAPLVSAMCFLAVPAAAGCNSKDKVYTCTGDVYPYSKSVDEGSDAYTFNFSDLEKTATNGSEPYILNIQSIASEGKDKGDDGKRGAPITLTFSGGTYGASGTSGGVTQRSTGGKGHDGKNRDGVGNISGGHGGNGGIASALSLSWNSGNLTANLDGFFVQSVGGLGGDGGEGKSDSGNGHGDNGGTGGVSQGVAAILGKDAALSISSGPLVFGAYGGYGGKGGKGATYVGEGKGGPAGVGGAAGNVSVHIDHAVTKTGIGQSSYGAISALSEGGAGGRGGNASGTVGSSHAADGGAGGSGGSVTVNATDGSGQLGIATVTQYNHGVLAQSVGGNGGDGGDGETDIGSKAAGGDGGKGGNGGSVAVYIKTTKDGVTTSGSEAQGILARSYGGSGGDGGKGKGGLADGKGGTGAGPGNGGAVNVALDGTIATSGDSSNAIMAQSVGGFSGDAGSSSGFAAYGSGSQSGGLGSVVTVTTQPGSSISTSGQAAAGILAQSVGGGGGRGSKSDGLVAVGGSGSSGGNGGGVNVNAAGSITTSGAQSVAIEASSVGGGGGSGGASGALVAMGGSAGSGGNGGAVTVTTDADLTTTKDQSDGIIAQSIGGGGGMAHSTSGMEAIGGSGGSGGTATTAKVVSKGGDIETGGDDSDGVFIQSVGGGGGSGSNAVAAGAQLTVAIGGSGGSGGNGGNAQFSDTAATSYSIETDGDRARGIIAQSVGGGGGDGGYAVSASAGYILDVSLGMSGGGSKGGAAGTVDVDTKADVTTSGDHSTGVQAMSVGGGGGSSGTSVASANSNGLSVSQTVGGSGGSGGAGGAVTLSSKGKIDTSGDAASAVIAQSIGGGGGSSGATISANGVSSISVSTAVGGKAGGGGDGKDVTATVAGNVTTTGDSSTAISMQSVGGSGGSAHTVIAATGATSTGSTDVAIGGNGGGGGKGGTVTGAVTGAVDTTGDNAIGVNAQSIGGSGGNGSMTVAGSLVSSGAANISVGGSGAASGSGGAVDLSVSGDVTTAGDNAIGVLAQSISNSGGHGGLAVDGSGVTYGDAAVGVGGSGGTGGESGTVDLTVAGVVSTTGMYATGVKAMSVGGGGGSATGAISGTLGSMGEVGVTIGGEGATGGDAGDVSVTTSNAIATTGDNSDGIYASSHGGSGGHGGFAIEGSLTAGTYAGSLNVNVGGAGGHGGTGGDVVVGNTADNVGEDATSIAVSGYESNGIFAQSVGGSGGRGGAVYSGNVTLSPNFDIVVGVDVGGSGGDGSLGGDVAVTNAGRIETDNTYGDGILAQSIGGDGGVGGSSYNVAAVAAQDSSANIQAVVGGDGGSGNHAGNVKVTNGPENILTNGDASNGIYAQSVGGGGGRAGSAASILFDVTDKQSTEATYSINANINVGGAGGSGGHAGSVDIDNKGPILTLGATSTAIYSQSIGGGGGDGGSVSGMVISVNSKCTFSKYGASCRNAAGSKSKFTPTLQVEIGGAGGSGGNGSSVTVGNTNYLETDGDVAPGIFAQSIGGGGGHGGYGSLGINAWAPDTIVDDIEQFIKGSATAAFTNLRSLQSVKLVVGGAGGSAGDGGEVAIDNSGTIVTNGASAYGIQAQSVGGGGGHGGNALGGFGSLWQINVGGTGSGGGHGGDVAVTAGKLTTYGDGSVAVFAQSVGGGGGSAGDIEASLTQSWDNLNVGMGAGVQLYGGGGGNGGDVTVNVASGKSSGIKTEGSNAHGIFAQSVGGTGGSAHLTGAFESNPLFSFNGSAGDVGKGGDIAITVDAGINVSGESAHGVFAQSVSGTIATDDRSSAAGDITVDVQADISATGGYGRAMLLQSEGKDGHGQIAVNVAKGVTVKTSSLGYETIGFMDGTGNTLTNAGSILRPETDSSLKGYVLRAESGALSVDNSGTINGSMLLDASAKNVIANTGTVGMGKEFTIGSKSTLQNDGIISAGTAGSVGTTSVSGYLSQSDQGAMQVDFDYTAAIDADLISVISGPAPDLSGEVAPNGINFLAQSGDSGTMTLLTSDVGIATNTLSVADSGTVSYSLSQQTLDGSDQIDLDFSVDYMAPAETENQRSFATYIDTLVGERLAELETSGSEYEFVDDFVDFINGLPSEEAVQAVYDTYTPGTLFMAPQAAFSSSLNFANALNSCDDPNEAGVMVYTEQGSCAHLTIGGGARRIDADSTSVGFDENRWTVTGGFQVEVAPDWFVGAALSYEDFELTGSDGSADGEGERYHLGAVLKREVGPTTFSASLSGGMGTLDLSRQIFTPVGAKEATSNPDTNWISAHGRVSRITELSDRHFIKPWLDLGVTRVQQDAFEEEDGGPHGLSVSESSATFVTLNPGVEAGTTFSTTRTKGAVKFRLGALGVFGDDGFQSNSRMLGANGSGSSFDFSDSTSKFLADVSLSVDAQVDDDIFLGAGIQALMNEGYQDYSIGLRFSYAF